MSGSVVYDSGALIAIADLRNRTAADSHRGRLVHDMKILVPAVVAAQVVRKPATQVPLMLALRGCEIVPFTAAHHVQVGQLLAKSGTVDVVDAFVALLAARTGAGIITGDPDDLGHLLSCLGVKRPVLPV
ncbi:MAG: PIN domain-containing protein [Actinomycetota bacterium]|nr:PIN domain-containing protein [Actinomycetota bacterium]